MADAFLDLQDHLKVDVNILLYCCWIGATGAGRLTGDQLAAIVEHVSDWQSQVVEPLRGVRSAMKSNPAKSAESYSEKLRAQVKNSELEAERIEQLMLFSAFPPASIQESSDSHRISDADANLNCYIDLLCSQSDQKVKKNISQILSGLI